MSVGFDTSGTNLGVGSGVVTASSSPGGSTFVGNSPPGGLTVSAGVVPAGVSSAIPSTSSPVLCSCSYITSSTAGTTTSHTALLVALSSNPPLIVEGA